MEAAHPLGMGVEQGRLAGQLLGAGPAVVAVEQGDVLAAALARRLQPDSLDAEVALGQEGADQLGMAALVFAHDLPRPVGGEVVGDEHLELERRPLGNGALDRAADSGNVIVGEDEGAARG